MSILGDEFKPIVLDLIQSGKSNHQILEHLQDNHAIIISEGTLTQRKADWGLSHHATLQTNQLEEHIRRYFHQGLTNAQIHRSLSRNHDYAHSQRTLERKIQEMDLRRRKEDIDDDDEEGMDVILHSVPEIHQTCEGHNVGYRKLKQLLQAKYGINVHLGIAAALNRALDPEGVEARSKRVLKRRVFKVAGPNFIWSADGHDKLKKFGIALYGFIDAWSRKVLGIFVHTTNNNPRHIGNYYLQLVKQAGGIPSLTTTDRGTETIDMTGHQVNLMQHFGDSENANPDQSHRYTKSIHNQKIECLWSQLMKQYNGELICQLYEADEKGYYDPEDPVDHLFFIYLWVPLLQKGLNEWVTNYNSFKRRFDKKSMLPSGCSADMCYENPHDFDVDEGLIPVDPSVVEELENEHYPDAEDLMRTSPQWLALDFWKQKY